MIHLTHKPNGQLEEVDPLQRVGATIGYVSRYGGGTRKGVVTEEALAWLRDKHPGRKDRVVAEGWSPPYESFGWMSRDRVFLIEQE